MIRVFFSNFQNPYRRKKILICQLLTTLPTSSLGNLRDPDISHKKVTSIPVSREKDPEAIECDNEDTEFKCKVCRVWLELGYERAGINMHSSKHLCFLEAEKSDTYGTPSKQTSDGDDIREL
jgi:hypothetical protein